MAAKQHTNFWGWASDHWFLTFLLASSALAIPVYAFGAAAVIAAPKLPPAGSGTTPFPPSTF
jgi:hypothetical protein